eukprot:549913_1
MTQDISTPKQSPSAKFYTCGWHLIQCIAKFMFWSNNHTQNYLNSTQLKEIQNYLSNIKKSHHINLTHKQTQSNDNGTEDNDNPIEVQQISNHWVNIAAIVLPKYNDNNKKNNNKNTTSNSDATRSTALALSNHSPILIEGP